jgi:tetratricopeptide (TPR) repeat protein
MSLKGRDEETRTVTVPGRVRRGRSARFLFLLCAASAVIHAPNPAASGQAVTDWALVHSTTMRGIHALYNMEMEKALSTFDSATALAPNDPRGRFFRSMVLFWTYSLKTEEADFQRFMSCSDTVIDICDGLLDQNADNAVARFYLGGIRGYRGLACQLNGSLLRAAYEGKEGYANLEEAVRLDSLLVDAQMGFGLFKILLAKIPRSIGWLIRVLGYEGDLEGGFRHLRAAAERGVYTRTEATFYLSQFLFQEHRQEEALTLMQGLLKEYPENSLFYVVYAGWNHRLLRFDEALRALRTAEEINRRKTITYGEEFIHSTRGSIAYSLNDFALARKEFDLFIASTRHREQIPNMTYYRIAVAREATGDRPGALEICRMMRDVSNSDWPGEKVSTRKGQELIDRPLSPLAIELIKGGNLLHRKAYGAADSLFRTILPSVASDPDLHAETLYGIQQSAIGMENDGKAVEAGLSLVRLRPERETWLIPHGWIRLAESYERMGRKAEALKALEHGEEFDDYDYQAGLTRTIKEIRERLSPSGP